MRNKRVESFLFGLYHLKSVIIASPWRIKACSVQRRTKTKTRDVESSVLQHLVWENSLSERHCVINLLFSATGVCTWREERLYMRPGVAYSAFLRSASILDRSSIGVGFYIR